MLKKEIELIVNSIPNNLSPLETARYLYLELGKVLCYNTAYSFASGEQKNHFIYSKEPVPTSNYVICTSAAQALSYATTLREFPFKIQTHSYIEIVHTDNILTIPEGNEARLLSIKYYC